MLSAEAQINNNRNSLQPQKQYAQAGQSNQVQNQHYQQQQQQKKNQQVRYSNSHYSSKSYHQKIPFIVGVHYKVGKKIGEGSFGVIYEGMEDLIKI